MDTGALMHFLQPRSHVSLYVALSMDRASEVTEGPHGGDRFSNLKPEVTVLVPAGAAATARASHGGTGRQRPLRVSGTLSVLLVSGGPLPRRTAGPLLLLDASGSLNDDPSGTQCPRARAGARQWLARTFRTPAA
jgi:hypothetical protein